jgi:hypothetical protein
MPGSTPVSAFIVASLVGVTRSAAVTSGALVASSAFASGALELRQPAIATSIDEHAIHQRALVRERHRGDIDRLLAARSIHASQPSCSHAKTQHHNAKTAAALR